MVKRLAVFACVALASSATVFGQAPYETVYSPSTTSAATWSNAGGWAGGGAVWGDKGIGYGAAVPGYPFRTGCCEQRRCAHLWDGFCAGGGCGQGSCGQGACGHGKLRGCSAGCGGQHIAQKHLPQKQIVQKHGGGALQKHACGGKGGACGCGRAFSFKAPKLWSGNHGCGCGSAGKGYAGKGHPVQSSGKGSWGKGHGGCDSCSGGFRLGLFDWLHRPAVADCGCHAPAAGKYNLAPPIHYDYDYDYDASPSDAPQLEFDAPPMNRDELPAAPEPTIESARRVIDWLRGPLH